MDTYPDNSLNKSVNPLVNPLTDKSIVPFIYKVVDNLPVYKRVLINYETIKNSRKQGFGHYSKILNDLLGGIDYDTIYELDFNKLQDCYRLCKKLIAFLAENINAGLKVSKIYITEHSELLRGLNTAINCQVYPQVIYYWGFEDYTDHVKETVLWERGLTKCGNVQITKSVECLTITNIHQASNIADTTKYLELLIDCYKDQYRLYRNMIEYQKCDMSELYPLPTVYREFYIDDIEEIMEITDGVIFMTITGSSKWNLKEIKAVCQKNPNIKYLHFDYGDMVIADIKNLLRSEKLANVKMAIHICCGYKTNTYVERKMLDYKFLYDRMVWYDRFYPKGNTQATNIPLHQAHVYIDNHRRYLTWQENRLKKFYE